MMRILIAEDNKQKVEKLIPFLTESNLAHRDNISICQSAHDVRAELQQNSYDLLILDLMLPLRPESEPQVANAIDLLQEIVETGEYSRPRQIVGLTAFDDAALEAQETFTNHLWTIIKFDHASDAWQGPIENCIRYLSDTREQEREVSYGTDVCVITALRNPEMDAIHRLDWNWKAERPVDNCTFVREGEFQCGSESYSVVSSVARRMGMVDAALLSQKLIREFRPRFIVITGICAGIRDKTDFGDVLYGQQVWDWQNGKIKNEDEKTIFEIAPDQLTANTSVSSYIQNLSNNKSALSSIKDGWPSAPTNELRLLSGPIVSGSCVIASEDMVEQIKLQHRSTIGIDMEAYGVFAAANFASFPQPIAISLKAVCDFADDKKDDTLQPYAAYTSANVMRVLFEEHMNDITSFARG
jgi:nucleoside phosphorylase/CheY-like chemotaxis protein